MRMVVAAIAALVAALGIVASRSESLRSFPTTTVPTSTSEHRVVGACIIPATCRGIDEPCPEHRWVADDSSGRSRGYPRV
jgi:hypothetical protein